MAPGGGGGGGGAGPGEGSSSGGERGPLVGRAVGRTDRRAYGWKGKREGEDYLPLLLGKPCVGGECD